MKKNPILFTFKRFLILLNAIAFRGKMLFGDLASLPRPTLIDHVLKPRDLWCKALLSFSSRSTKWRKQRVFFIYLFNDTSHLHDIPCYLILEAQTGHVISSCKALMCKKSIEGFVVLFVHANITIIHNIIWKIALLKKSSKKEIT